MENVLHGSKWTHMDPNGLKRSENDQIFKICPNLSQFFQICPKCFKMVQNFPKFLKMTFWYAFILVFLEWYLRMTQSWSRCSTAQSVVACCLLWIWWPPLLPSSHRLVHGLCPGPPTHHWPPPTPTTLERTVITTASQTMQCNAHCVLLGPKYALKKTCLSCNASSFDESYASPGHNGKKIMVFYPEALKEKPKNFFLQRHLWAVPTWDQ